MLHVYKTGTLHKCSYLQYGLTLRTCVVNVIIWDTLKRVILLFLVQFFCAVVYAQQTDTLEVYFHQGQSLWVPEYKGNSERLQAFVERFRQLNSDKVYNKISKIHIVAGCSPEGYWEYNQRLSKNRAKRIRAVLKDYIILPDSLVVEHSRGINWEDLRKMVVADPMMPYKEEVLHHLDNSPEIVRNAEGKIVETRKLRLMYLKDGIPWKYMYSKFFPTLRSFNLAIVIEWEKLEAVQLEVKKEEAEHVPVLHTETWRPLAYEYQLPPKAQEQQGEKPFYMALKTNTLYDIALVPNIGVEFHLGRNWSATANWMYAWWKNDNLHWYWRIYGGEVGLRKWFGRAASAKPLTGHHLGIYGQMLTYDFEVGGRGYMGGVPEGTLWDKAHYGAGIEYGYSHPIGRRLNLDFTIGAGYLGGEYREYIPQDDCYVWQVTKQRHWIGPTKAEISLVWLLGKGNVNNK